jgi:hypothetical protein
MSQSKFSFECVKIRKEITRRLHVALDVDGLPGWISNTAKPQRLECGIVLGADGLRPGCIITGLQACRLDTSLIFFPFPTLGPSSFFGETTMEHRYIYEFSFLGFNSILLHRHGPVR